MKNLIKKFSIICLTLFINSSYSQSDWVELFNGKNLDGWEIKQGKANFEILPNGVIQGTSILNSPSTYLCSKSYFDDFILEFEVNVSTGLNSGVQFRSLINTNNPTKSVYGYQIELEANKSDRLWSGGIYDQSRRDFFLYPLADDHKGRGMFKNDSWNKIRVEAVGSVIRTWVNGTQCANLIDDATKKGFIALQIHSINNKSNNGKKVKWRNMRILTENIKKNRWPLESYAPEINYIDNYLTRNQISSGWKFLWDGKTFEGWRGAFLDKFPENGWKIENGILSVESSSGLESRNGGDIITLDKYENFELEIDFKITKGANSGIKYFVDTSLNKGSESAIGLEYQILDNKSHPDGSQRFKVLELKNGKWVDFKEGVKKNRGVSSLYDLIEAEQVQWKSVVPNTWHRAKIISFNGHVEHWLDNVKVLEYNRFSQVFKSLVEYSKYSIWENFGQSKSGHILLQDHGDEVLFKNIKIKEF